jgi:hypothetical protein
MQRYRALHMFATLLRLSAGIVLMLGLLASVLLTVASVAGVSRLGWGKLGSVSSSGLFVRVSSMAGSGTVLFALLVGLGCVVLYLVLTAAGDLIRLLLDIEENTRSAAYFVGPRP